MLLSRLQSWQRCSLPLRALRLWRPQVLAESDSEWINALLSFWFLALGGHGFGVSCLGLCLLDELRSWLNMLPLFWAFEVLLFVEGSLSCLNLGLIKDFKNVRVCLAANAPLFGLWHWFAYLICLVLNKHLTVLVETLTMPLFKSWVSLVHLGLSSLFRSLVDFEVSNPCQAIHSEVMHALLQACDAAFAVWLPFPRDGLLLFVFLHYGAIYLVIQFCLK